MNQLNRLLIKLNILTLFLFGNAAIASVMTASAATKAAANSTSCNRVLYARKFVNGKSVFYYNNVFGK